MIQLAWVRRVVRLFFRCYRSHRASGHSILASLRIAGRLHFKRF